MTDQVKKAARSLRDNDPGNIRKGQTIWQGQVTDPTHMTNDQQKEQTFCVFKSPAYGFRALCKLLLTYERAYGLNTPRKIIERWAPPNENNTGNYIARVASALGTGMDQTVALSDPDTLARFAKAIATVEAGSWVWLDDDLQQGVKLALS